MAIGDDAIAAGMSVLNGTEQADDIDLYINETRDYIAQRTSAVTPVAKGGTAGTTALQARINLGITAVNVPTNGSNVQADIDALATGKRSNATSIGTNGAYGIDLIYDGLNLQLFVNGGFIGYVSLNHAGVGSWGND